MARRTVLVAALAVTGALLLGVIASIGAADSGNRFRAQRMLGTFEVPAVSSAGARGSFEATLQGSTVTYKLTYSGLGSAVTQSHIHFAQTFASGGISVWLCQTAANPAPASVSAVTPTCPQSGEVNDTFNAAEVLNTPGGPSPPAASQGIAAGEFEELLAAMRNGLTYANVHSASIPGGEIRGQIKARGGDGDDD